MDTYSDMLVSVSTDIPGLSVSGVNRSVASSKQTFFGEGRMNETEFVRLGLRIMSISDHDDDLKAICRAVFGSADDNGN